MLGYCCICLGVNDGRRKKDEISVNRGMVRRTFDAKGLAYVSELVQLNLRDTLSVLKWNKANDIYPSNVKRFFTFIKRLIIK